MNRSDWNHAILNHIDPELVEQAAAPTKKRTTRPVRIAVIAACLCGLLVGGAFAAETVFGIPIFKPMDTSPVTGEPINGFTTIIEVPEEIETPEGTAVNPLENQSINGVFKLPVDTFGQAVQNAAANLSANTLGQLSFNSWEKAEEFLGKDLMNNAVLAEARPGLVFYDDENSVGEAACRVNYTAMDGILTGASANSVWYLNYVDRPLPEEIEDLEGGVVISNSVPVRVEVMVQSYTKHSPIAPDEMFLGLSFPEGWTFTPETYTTPSGLVVNIVGVNIPDEVYGQITEYYAQFALNGNAVTVIAGFIPDADHALATLKQVLDAFE